MSLPLDDHYFRRESGRLLATLTRILGAHRLALAEDVVQDTLATAVEVWSFRGIPENSSAWLMTAAKNRAISLLRREQTARKFEPELQRTIDDASSDTPLLDELSVPAALRDDELRMMFSCCCPQIPEEAQIALVLSLLCGFSASEVASAFLASVPAIEKRISRGKKVLAKSTKLFELSADDFVPRLAVVQRALYLLFSEGYHGASAEEDVVRVDLCREAMRLVALLLEYPPAATPSTFALAALMHLHAARLPARVDAAGELTVLFEQDRSRWDAMLIARGLELLDASATGDVVSEYHLEAGIAATHATAPSASQTAWASIVKLYDTLFRLRPSPVVALNRAIAIGELEGPERGLEVLQAIHGRERLAAYPFYAAAMGEMELRCRRIEQALTHFCAARALARSDAERRFLDRRVAVCERLAMS